MSVSPIPNLNPAEICDLAALAGTMIPASTEYGVPGADDPAIQADILATLGRDLDDVRAALAAAARLAGGCFADLDAARREQVMTDLTSGANKAVGTLGRVVLAAYYRDARVVRALGLEPGAPFPKGRTLEQGDWSLLDAVRGRAPMWRAEEIR
jgi:hypothetical protein